VSLYFLTFAEFLDSDVLVLYTVATGNAVYSCQLVLAATALLAIGRHLPLPILKGGSNLPNLANSKLFSFFIACIFLGYLWPLISVSFNPIDLVNGMLGPRFTQPWQRGREGNWTSFLSELSLLLYIASALAGYIVTKTRDFNLPIRLAVIVLTSAMLLFDIAAGARNVVLLKVGLIVVSVIFANPKARNSKIIGIAALSISTALTISGQMLIFRNQGLANYIENSAIKQSEGRTFMIDNNLVTIARVVSVFPSQVPFPGSDIVISSATKWVPRALWPNKPKQWRTSLEDAFGVGQYYTLATTFVGEAYLIAGIPSLIIISLLFGSLSATWNRVGQASSSNLDLVLYISGFMVATLGMRSMQFITVSLVPTFTIYFFGRLLQTRKSRGVVIQNQG